MTMKVRPSYWTYSSIPSFPLPSLFFSLLCLSLASFVSHLEVSSSDPCRPFSFLPILSSHIPPTIILSTVSLLEPCSLSLSLETTSLSLSKRPLSLSLETTSPSLSRNDLSLSRSLSLSKRPLSLSLETTALSLSLSKRPLSLSRNDLSLSLSKRPIPSVLTYGVSLPAGAQTKIPYDFINRHFTRSSVDQIVRSLEGDTDPQAAAALKTLRGLCPTSVKVPRSNILALHRNACVTRTAETRCVKRELLKARELGTTKRNTDAA